MVHRQLETPTIELVTESPAVIRMSELIAALSYALDITEGQPQGHAARTCLIGMRIARHIGLSNSDQSALFYGLLLKDLGCSSNAAKMCYLFGADDRSVKHDVKTIDWSKTSENFQFVRNQVAPDGTGLEKLMKLVSLALEGSRGPQKLIQTRCERGAFIARQLGFTDATATGIHQLDEHWDGNGYPLGLKGREISLLGSVMGFAQTLEVFYSLQGLTAATDMALDRRGRWFDPELVDAFLALRDDTAFWRMVAKPNPHEQVSQFEPEDQILTADEAQLDRIADAFASVVDAKSPWTFKHSSGVADIAVGIAEVLGQPPRECREIRRMGLLHDIGKLGVSNLILDKPGKLDKKEFETLKRHTEYTHTIVARVGCLRDLAHFAAAHHEKLDGSGYHRGIRSGALPISARLLAVADIFEALSAARPYRPGMPLERIFSILDTEAGTTICAESYAALRTWLERNKYNSRVETQLAAVEKLVAEL